MCEEKYINLLDNNTFDKNPIILSKIEGKGPLKT